MVKIEVLGSGCANCKRLEKLAQEAVAGLGVEAEVVKVTDMKEIMAKGVMATPGLVVDGQVVSKGRVPSASEVKSLIASALA
jgi:small redox-active disulfide protein 2